MAMYGETALSDKAKKRYLCDENINRLEVLKELSKRHNASIASVICGAFSSFKLPEVFPVIGGRTIEQISDSLCGADLMIDINDLERIFNFNLK